MKVIFVINVDFALHHFLLPLLRGARARGHDVVGICAEGPMLQTARAEGFRIIPVPLVRRLAPWSQWRALRTLIFIMRSERPDLVHAHMPISGLLARIAARMTSVPRVAYTCHGFLFNQPGPLVRRAASLLLEWGGGRLTDIYLTVSASEALDARRLWIARSAQPVGNGRDPSRFHPDPQSRLATRSVFGVPATRVVIIIVARLVRHKGYPELLVAMRDLNAELWVVGERLPSDHGADLEPVFAKAQLGHKLRRLGARDDVPALLAAADIFVLPSLFEGLPMSIIEAMLTGLPVVACNVPGPREQVDNGRTGLLVAPGSASALAAALHQLIDDAELRTAMGSAGRIRALQLYDESKVIGHTLDLLGL